MPCHYPLRAYRIADRLGRPEGVVFVAKNGMNVIQHLTLPCGQCTGCKVEHARQWAVRCMHEAQLHKVNCFVTLTYDDQNLPDTGTLDGRHVTLFLKKLRNWASVYDYKTRKVLEGSKIRYFACGEYGETGHRPHYHIILFNWDFPDKTEWKPAKSGAEQYQSELLNSLWGKGLATVAVCNFATAQYVARYVTKKLGTNPRGDEYKVIAYEDGEVLERQKEFVRMSLKPGIGYEWYKKFGAEVFPLDRVVVNGMEVKPPSYYTRKYKQESPELYDELQYQRHGKGVKNAEDRTEERLAVRERVLKAKLEHFAGKRVF